MPDGLGLGIAWNGAQPATPLLEGTAFDSEKAVGAFNLRSGV
jgi:hypothetical protein